MVVNEVARVYAGALVELGQEKNLLQQVEEELAFVSSLVEEDKDLLLYLKAPGITKDDKKNLVDKVFKGQLSEVTVNFIKILIDNDRQMSIRDINEAFKDMMDDVNKRLRVSLVSSDNMDDGSINKIKETLKQKYGKEIILDMTIDKSILGGIIIKVGDLIIDGSLAKDLNNIREQLLFSKIRSEVAYED